jgi:hypothetical protein
MFAFVSLVFNYLLMFLCLVLAFKAHAGYPVFPEEEGEKLSDVTVNVSVEHLKTVTGHNLNVVSVVNKDERFGNRILIENITVNNGECGGPRYEDLPIGFRYMNEEDKKSFLVDVGYHPSDADWMVYHENYPDKIMLGQSFLPINEEVLYYFNGDCEIKTINFKVFVEERRAKIFSVEL